MTSQIKKKKKIKINFSILIFTKYIYLKKVIATSGVNDVREVLDYYNKEIDPLETFKLNQVKLHVRNVNLL